MLTLKAIIKTSKQLTAFGEGKHRFDGFHQRVSQVPRDKSAQPKTEGLIVKKITHRGE